MASIKTKEWRVYYTRKRSRGFDVKADLIAFIHKEVASGGSIHNITHGDRILRVTEVFGPLGILQKAKVKLSAMSNNSPTPKTTGLSVSDKP